MQEPSTHDLRCGAHELVKCGTKHHFAAVAQTTGLGKRRGKGLLIERVHLRRKRHSIGNTTAKIRTKTEGIVVIGVRPVVRAPRLNYCLLLKKT